MACQVREAVGGGGVVRRAGKDCGRRAAVRRVRVGWVVKRLRAVDGLLRAVRGSAKPRRVAARDAIAASLFDIANGVCSVLRLCPGLAG